MDNEYNLSKVQIDIIDKFRDMKYLYKSTVSNYLKTRFLSREYEQQIYDVLRDLKGDNFIDVQ